MTNLETKHVLIVEDDLRNATLITAMSKIAGVNHTWMCHNGKEIFTTAQQMPSIELVLLDLQLPGEDGYQILERLRCDPLFQKVPIVAVTAQVMPDDVDKAEAVGFYGFIGKPLNFDRFPGQMRRLLSGERVWEPR
jgi:two-component system, cell cycle response regulator DivK